ncbi:scabin-related ADP-ribosyltransferase [Streptomyces sp. NPDC002521]
MQDTSGRFGDKLNAVAGALETYMVKAAEIVKQLETLREHARVFVESVKGHDSGIHTWRSDPDQVAEHKAIWDGVNAAVAAFEQAEVTCADKITALVGGTQWHINNGKPGQKNAYGFSAGQLAQADSLPWGRPEHEEMLPFGIDYHLQQVGVSLWDNAKGSVTGLIDLFSPGDDGNATREGLVRVIAGAEGYLLDPYGDHNTHLGPASDQLMEDSKPYAKQFAKSFVAWDDWQTNPGKAFGTVLFNGLTLASGPLGAASRAGAAAGEASAVARVAGTVAKVGEVLDPIGAATKAVGVAARTLPKVSDLVSGVRAATEAANSVDKAHSFLEYPDGSHLRIEDGQFIPGKHGVTDSTPAPHEPAADDRMPSVSTPDRHHELVGAGARTSEATAHAGEHPSVSASHEGAGGGASSASHDPGELPGKGGAHGDAHPGTESGHAHPGEHPGAGGSSHGGGGHGSDSSPAAGASGDEPDRLAAATDRNIDLDKLGIPPVWREGHEPLYRSDNRSPDVVFEHGFEPRDPSNTDLRTYVEEDDPSAFVSTSYRDDIGDDFGGKFTYVIDAPGGIDANRTLGDHSLSYEEEVAFPGGIRSEYIKGAYSYDYATGELGEFVPNPNYIPGAQRVK